MFLRQGLEIYEGLQQKWRESRRRQIHSPRKQIDLCSESEDSTDTSGDSSDHGIDHKGRLRCQKEAVHYIVATIRKVITKEVHSWRRRELSQIFEKVYTHRLERIGIHIVPISDRERLLSGTEIFTLRVSND